MLLSLEEELETPILDLGCGTGTLKDLSKDVVGLDIAVGMLKVYKQKGGIAVLGKGEELPFRDKSFGTVISNFSLHWMDLDRVIPEIKRVVRRRFLASIPVKGSLPQFGFPFPETEHLLKLLELHFRIRTKMVMEVPIPFRGWDLLKFFHYTGTSYNPCAGSVKPSRKELERLVELVDNPTFKVLFFSCEVIV